MIPTSDLWSVVTEFERAFTTACAIECDERVRMQAQNRALDNGASIAEAMDAGSRAVDFLHANPMLSHDAAVTHAAGACKGARR